MHTYFMINKQISECKALLNFSWFVMDYNIVDLILEID